MDATKIRIQNTISIIGMGYVGLCLAGSLSKLGYKTICVDIDAKKVQDINSGISPIFEPQLPELIKFGVEKGLITATTNIEEAIHQSHMSFLCVGTPSDDEGNIDLSFIKNASKSIGFAFKSKNSYHVVAVKSTVIPGTTDSVIIPLLEQYSQKKVGLDFGVCMTPEFLKEGNSVNDFFNPDKIVIGAFDSKSKEIVYDIFSHFWPDKLGKDIFVFSDLRNAEMIKYANNSFLATKISFINEMANLSEEFGVDIKIVSKALGMDKRISPYNLDSGLGFGGSCLPKDVSALYNAGRKVGYESRILKSTLDVNKEQPYRPIRALKEILTNLNGKAIAILGLSFKPGTDDIRYAPSKLIVENLINSGANIQAYDPVAIENFKNEMVIGHEENLKFYQSALDALKGADAAIIVTEWKEFTQIENNQFINLMKSPIIVDGRRIYEPDRFIGTDITYIGLGISNSKKFKPS